MAIDVHLRDRPLQRLVSLGAEAGRRIDGFDRELQDRFTHLHPLCIYPVPCRRCIEISGAGPTPAPLPLSSYSTGCLCIFERSTRRPIEIAGQNRMSIASAQIPPTRPFNQKLEKSPPEKTPALRKLHRSEKRLVGKE